MKRIWIVAGVARLCVLALALSLLSSLSALAANEAMYAARATRPQYVSYRSFAKQLDMTGKFGAMGVTTRCFFAANTINHGGNPYCEYPLIWKDFGRYDWSAFEAQADDLIKASPNADFLVMIDLNTPYWATHKFWLDSFTLVSHAASDRDWIAKTTVWMTNFIAHAEARYGDRIRAYILSGGGTSEWYEYNRGFTSSKKDAAWVRWQKRNGVDFGASVPPQTELEKAAFENLVYDPSAEAEKIAYWKFHNGVIADALLAYAKTARALVPRTKEIGAFFGYYLVSDAKQTSFGHLDYGRVYASPDIDFFIAPGNYSDRTMGGGSGSQLVMGTALLNGKRFLHEIDYGPHTQRHWMAGQWKTLADDLAGNTREAAFTLANQANCWWFDMWGGRDGFYDQPELRERIAKLKRIQDARKGDASPSAAQILIVADPESIYGVNEKDKKERGFGQHLRNKLSTTGATFDVFSFDDLPRLDLSQYRLICLNSTILITPERAKFLKEKVCCGGRTVLWLYAPGLSDGRSLDTDRVKAWAGVAFKTPGISTTDRGDWTSVYAYAYNLYTTEALIGILERAGAHRYVKEPLCVYANETFVSVHTKEGGRKTVYLPKKAAKVVDLLTDEVVATDTDRFEADFASPDTRLFGIEP